MASNPHYNVGLLWRALAISLLLHAALLLQPGAGVPAPTAFAARSLNALLKTKADNVPRTGSSASTALHAASSLTQPHAAPGRAAATAVSTADVPVTAAEVGRASSDAAAAVDAVDNAPINRASVASAADADVGEQRKAYLFAIADQARRIKKYPPRALAAGRSGTVEIRIAVIGGHAQPPQLEKSSGYRDIDDAALLLVDTALKRTPLPPGLRSGNFDLTLPIVFDLRDE